jgi:Putative collagen-binding domain of a collagenase
MHCSARGEGINKPISDWREAIDSPGAWQIRHARALLVSRTFLTRIPDNSLIVPGSVPNAVPGAGTKFMNATRSSDGECGMIYSATSRGYSLNPAALSGKSLHFWWFNPRDGSHIDLGVFPRSNLVEVTPPSRGEDLDWVLVVDDGARDFPAPGSGGASSTAEKGELRFR